jgi:hypothetical protein
MSQKIVSQKIEKTCDGCGVRKEYETVGLTPEVVLELQEWRTIWREIYAGGEWAKVPFHACSNACLAAADLKVDTALHSEEPPDNIDLDSLRTRKPN